MVASTEEISSKIISENLFNITIDIVNDVVDDILDVNLQTLDQSQQCAHFKAKTVYEIDIGSMSEAFRHDGVKVGNFRQFFRGTCVHTIFLSIFRNVMIIPRADNSESIQVTDSMFGDGLHFRIKLPSPSTIPMTTGIVQ